jgi:DNA-binding response OmpR family regulator
MPDSSNLPPLRVLIIEDNPDDKIIAEAMLADIPAEGMVVAWETNLGRGIDRVAEFDPDVVLLDLMLPDSSSPSETISRFRAAHPEVACVVLSSVSDDLVVWKAGQDAQIDAIFNKRELGAMDAQRKLFDALRRAFFSAHKRGTLQVAMMEEVSDKLNWLIAEMGGSGNG